MLKIAITFALILTTTSAVFAQADERSRSWNQPVAPFHIAGNLYYVGANEIASYLITTAKGHLLLDGGFAETATQIQRNITQLGFNLSDVKILLSSHAHFDHAGGLAELKRLTRAKLLASERDAELLRRGGKGDFRFGDSLPFPPVEADRIIHDGEQVQLDDQIMTAHLTPGHTRGNTSWTTKVREGAKTYDVVLVGSQSSLDYQFVGQESYPGIKADFERSFAVLKALPCDIPLGSHASFFRLKEKHEGLARGEKDVFLDPKGYKTYLEESEKDFREKVAQQEQKAGSK